jgi:hypothetical protein
MENLQQKVSEVPIAKEKVEARTENKPLYEGLSLVENVSYAGGTSIKYWM